MRRLEGALAVTLAVAASAVASAGSGVAGSEPPALGATPMLMGGSQRFGRVLLDQLEWRPGASDDTGAWEIEGWYGGDLDKLWLRTEGEQSGSQTRNARGELLWDRAVDRWWSLQAGLREDFADGPPRTWAALGVEGLAPYWLTIEATLYVGEGGRTAARLKAEHDVLLTQRLILQPEAQLNVYGKRDPARRLDSGLSDVEVGLRLRYEIRRELAPYIGIAWTREARLTTVPGASRSAPLRAEAASEARFVAGVRAWF